MFILFLMILKERSISGILMIVEQSRSIDGFDNRGGDERIGQLALEMSSESEIANLEYFLRNEDITGFEIAMD